MRRLRGKFPLVELSNMPLLPWSSRHGQGVAPKSYHLATPKVGRGIYIIYSYLRGGWGNPQT